jgi:hypothetical protein
MNLMYSPSNDFTPQPSFPLHSMNMNQFQNIQKKDLPEFMQSMMDNTPEYLRR